jgi:hypothetical protein
VCGFPGWPVTRNRMAPQMQPPSWCLVFMAAPQQAPPGP